MKRWRKTGVGGFASIVILLALVPGGLALLGGRYPFELFAHFRVHYLVASILCLSVLLALRSWRWAAVALLVAAVHAWAVAPWWFGGDAGATGGTPIKLLIANVNTRNTRHADVLALIEREQPDVIVLMETNDRWIDAMSPITGKYTHAIHKARNDNFGIALFSRFPLIEPAIVSPGDDGLPSIAAGLASEGGVVQLLATHPLPPVSNARARSRDTQLIEAADWVSRLDGPRILTGDLNVTMWSPVYKRTVGGLGLTNTRRGFGVRPTWPSRFGLAGIPIDHCLVSEHFGVTGCRVGPDIGSDHRPLVVELRLKPVATP